jgi:hypothetical protein
MTLSWDPGVSHVRASVPGPFQPGGPTFMDELCADTSPSSLICCGTDRVCGAVTPSDSQGHSESVT